MNKVIPILVLVGAIMGFLMSLIGIISAFLGSVVSAFGILAVVVLFISCVICSIVLACSLVFKHRLCKIALVLDVFACLFIAVGFIVSYAV